MTAVDDCTLDPAALEALWELAGDDESFVETIFRMYEEQAEINVEKLRVAFAAGDAQAFGRAAHSLRGASLNIGAARVAGACGAVESTMAVAAARPQADQLGAVEAELSSALTAIAALRRPDAR